MAGNRSSFLRGAYLILGLLLLDQLVLADVDEELGTRLLSIAVDVVAT